MYVYCRYLFDCFRANRKKNYFHTWCGKRLTKNATRGVDLLIAHTGFNSLRSMTHFPLFFNWINNDNWTEWSEILAEIIHMISKLNECAAWVWFGITIMILDQNCTTRGSITTLLHSFWNYPWQIQDLVSSNILLMQHWASLSWILDIAGSSYIDIAGYSSLSWIFL